MLFKYFFAKDGISSESSSKFFIVLKSWVVNLRLFTALALAISTLLRNSFFVLFASGPGLISSSSGVNKLKERSYFSPYSLAFLNESSLFSLYMLI